MPDYSTVCRRQKTRQVQISYRPSAQPSHLLVDSTGIQFLGESEWKRRKCGADDTRGCRDAIALRGAQTVMPPRSNASVWHRPSPGVESRNEAVRACSRLGRCLWKTWSGYHRRSLVETKMDCFRHLGERVTARTFER